MFCIFAKKYINMQNIEKYVIYKITSPINEVYIGQSKNVKVRFQNYKSTGAKAQSKLNFSFLKYGWINHIFEVIEEKQCTQEEIDIIETNHINMYKSQGNSLNIAFGGKRGNKGIPRAKGADSPISKKVYQYDLEGNFIKEWGSIIDAAKNTNTSYTQLSKCIINSTRCAGNYLWLSEKDYKNGIVAQRENKQMIKCVQLDKNNNFIAFHNSISEALRKNNLKGNHIKDCIDKKRKTCGGFKWMLKEDYLKLIKV